MMTTQTLNKVGLTLMPMAMNGRNLRMLDSIKATNIVEVLTGKLNLDPSGSDFDPSPYVVLVWASDLGRLSRHRAPSLRLAAIFRSNGDAQDWIARDTVEAPPRYYRFISFFEGNLSDAFEIEAREPVAPA